MSVPVASASGTGFAELAGTIGPPPQVITGCPSAGARTTTTRVEHMVLASCSPGRKVGAAELILKVPHNLVLSFRGNYLLIKRESTYISEGRHLTGGEPPPSR